MAARPLSYGSLPTYEKEIPLEVTDYQHSTSSMSDEEKNEWPTATSNSACCKKMSGASCSEQMKNLCLNGPVTTLAVLVVFGLLFFTGKSTLHHDEHAATVPGSSDGVHSYKKPLLSPVDMGLLTIDRTGETSPGKVWGSKLLKDPQTGRNKPLPTNIWYLNLLSQNAGEHSTEANRVYTVPYIVDTVGPITGMRLHWPIAQASDRNTQMVYNAQNGLTVGTADPNIGKQYYLDDDDGRNDMSFLGVSIKWAGKQQQQQHSMTSHLVRGMAYATMKYTGDTLPTVVSGNIPASPPLIDGGKTKLTCGDIITTNDGIKGTKTINSPPAVTVKNEIQLHFKNSDFTWIVFFSRPVQVQCAVAKVKTGPGVISPTMFQMNVVKDTKKSGNGNDEEEEPLIVRAAMLNQCTTGKGYMHEHCREDHKWKDKAGYLKALRESAHLYSKHPIVDVDYSYDADDEDEDGNDEDSTRVTFDWDVQSTTTTSGGFNEDEELLMFALPHHQAMLEPIKGTSSNVVTDYCAPTFHGNTCLVKGSKWSLMEDLGAPQSFIGNRPPEASAIPDLAEAIAHDIKYALSDNLQRGAIDTYFSGKILARLGRVILVASELKALAASSSSSSMTDYLEDDPQRYSSTAEACKQAQLPSEDEITHAVDRLRRGVEVWLNDKAEAPFVYDNTWGGLVNCGCNYSTSDEHGVCKNTFPNCPALNDVNVNFGNGFYNDHHFHYGYHLYAAAVVAKYDQEWGRKFYDRVLLYVRDIANPFADDEFFPQFRQKDWYLGSSWASGFISADTPHGRNQESSSEAIAAYEAMTLFGDVMMDAFSSAGEDATESAKDAKQVRDAGRLMTAMEVKATQQYWHVWNSDTHNNTYPAAYKQPVVGMLYETMASFQTWFAGGDVASFGIQVLPFTPVSERNTDPDWAAKLYPAFKKSCASSQKNFCVRSGWSIALSGLRSIIGERESAAEDAKSIPEIVFKSPGGNGHSLTNTLWYISTRPDVTLRTPSMEDKSTATDADSSNNELKSTLVVPAKETLATDGAALTGGGYGHP